MPTTVSKIQPTSKRFHFGIDRIQDPPRVGLLKIILPYNPNISTQLLVQLFLLSYRFHLHRFPVRIGCPAGNTSDLDPPGQAHPGDSLGVPACGATPITPKDSALAGRALDPGALTVVHDYRTVCTAAGTDHDFTLKGQEIPLHVFVGFFPASHPVEWWR
jgi:hypothetical protein